MKSRGGARARIPALALITALIATPASAGLLAGFEGTPADALPGVIEGSSGGPEIPDCSVADLFAKADRPGAVARTSDPEGLQAVEGKSVLRLSTSPLDASDDELRQSRWRFVFEVEEASLFSLAYAFRTEDEADFGDWYLIALDGQTLACGSASGLRLDSGRSAWMALGLQGEILLEPGLHVFEAAVGDGVDRSGRSDLLLDELFLRPASEASAPPPTACRPAPPEDVGEIPNACTLPMPPDCSGPVLCTSPRRVWTFDDNRFCPDGSIGSDADGDGMEDCLGCSRPEDVGDPNPRGSCFECTDATNRYFEMYVVADCGTVMHLPLNDVESGCISVFDQDRNPVDIVVDNGAGFREEGGEVCWMAEDCDGGGQNDPGGPGDARTMDVQFTAEPSLCGVFIARFRSWAGCIWDLFANCDGTNTQQFLIFDDFCEAEDAYDPLPELIVRDLQTSAAEACGVNYCVTVSNIGCIVAASHSLRVANETDAKLHDVPALASGEAAMFCGRLDLDPLAPDPHVTRVRAFADWGNSLLECTEDATASSCNAATGGDVIERVQVVNCNTDPICDAGGPYSAECDTSQGGATAIPLDGTGSSDPNDDPLSFAWSSNCPGASFDDSTSATPTLLLSGPACDLSCQVFLTVSDPSGGSSSCSAPVSVNDSVAPTLLCPEDVAAECGDESVPTRQEWLSSATAQDACDPNPIITRSIRFASNPCEDSLREVWEFRAEDACGNRSATCQRTFAVEDTQPPVLSLPADRVVECPEDPEADVNAWAMPASADDACSGRTLVSRELLSTLPGCGGTEVRTYRFRAEDRCGNFAEDTRTWTSVDTTAPLLRNLPPDSAASCDSVPAPAPVRADDACDPDAGVVLVETREDGGCPDRYVLVRRWTASDACGNESEGVQRISVDDLDRPTLEGVPDDASAPCSDVPEPPFVDVTDDCDPEPALSFLEQRTDGPCPDSYTLLRTWTGSDRCGNQTTESQTLTVSDDEAPLLRGVPDDFVTLCDMVPPPAFVTAIDDCDPRPAVAFAETREPGSCEDQYTLRRTWTATDRCGNQASATQEIEVIDPQSPFLLGVPADASVDCDALPPPPIVQAVDNCDPFPVVVLNEQRSDGSCPDEYTLTRTWTATDRCGNSSSSSQVLSVSDTTPPLLQGVPATVRVECHEVPPPASPTASDDCDPDPAIEFEETRGDGGCPDRYVLTRTWTSTDRCGNSSSQSQTVIVRDLTSPALAGVPADLSVECDAVPAPAVPSASDNCDPAPALDFAELRSDGDCPDRYTLTRTWTATDRCGNSSSQVQTIEVLDRTEPVLAGVPADLTVECDAVPAPASPSASDNCDPAPALDFAELRSDGDCPDRYTLTRTWTATDRCGNSSSQVQTIEVLDRTEPVLAGVPADLTVECDAVPAPASPSASDNCDPAPALAFQETRTDGDCPFRYTLTRTWTATDRCGNARQQSQIVTVEDTTPPVLTAPDDLTVECPEPQTGPDSEAGWLALATATDNCGVPEVLSAELSRTPACGLTYEAVFELWAVDACGNESARVQRRYTVVDTTPPVLSAPEDLVVECPAPETGPSSEAAWLASASATDTCGDAEVLTAFVERIPGCGNTYTHVWDYWARDECGNESASVRRRYEVIDTTPPVFDQGMPLFDESLWPPNHGYVVFATDDMASATDACGEVTLAVTGCASSQPEEVHQGLTEDGGNGDGRTFEDCVWEEAGSEFAARAERLGACGKGSRRLYSVEITATDECGNSATAAGLLSVEHDRSGKQPVRRGKKLGPNDPPPWPHVHDTVYGEGCGPRD